MHPGEPTPVPPQKITVTTIICHAQQSTLQIKGCIAADYGSRQAACAKAQNLEKGQNGRNFVAKRRVLLLKVRVTRANLASHDKKREPTVVAGSLLISGCSGFNLKPVTVIDEALVFNQRSLRV